MEGDAVDLVGFMRVVAYDKHNPEKIRETVNVCKIMTNIAPARYLVHNLMNDSLQAMRA